MQTVLTEEQRLIQSSAMDWLNERYTSRDRAHGIHRDGGSPAVWQAFAQMGWLGLPLPEEYGGLEAGLLECGLLAQALGRHLVVEPWLGCVAEAARVLVLAGSPAQKSDWLPGVAEGVHRLALAHREECESGLHDGWAPPQTFLSAEGKGWRLDGAKKAIADAGAARCLIVSARDGQGAIRLCLVETGAPGVSVEAYDATDGSRAADLRFDNVAVNPHALLGAGDSRVALHRALAEAQVLALWFGTGAMQAALELTLAHVQQRRQFGQVLAQFQSVQQRLAEMSVHCAEAQAACELSTLRLAAPAQAHPARVAAFAGSKVLRAAREVAQGSVQLHGAMGVCEEVTVAPAFRRLLALDAALGGATLQAQTLARGLLADSSFAISATLGPPETTTA